MSDFTNKQTDALKEFLFENNFDRTPLRETCFRKGYEMGFAQAQSELTTIGVSDMESLRTRLASAEEALGLILKHGQYAEVTGLREMLFTSARLHFEKFPPSDK